MLLSTPMGVKAVVFCLQPVVGYSQRSLRLWIWFMVSKFKGMVNSCGVL